MMQEKTKGTIWFVITPLWVLAFGKALMILFSHYIPKPFSWIPAFGAYYLAIILAAWFLNRKGYKVTNHLSLKPFPPLGLFLGTILIPALLPLMAFISQFRQVPNLFWVYIALFALINAPMEEWLWRGIMGIFPVKKGFKVLYSAFMFSFSHLFFWHYWFEHPMITIPTVVSTFLMGLLWMLFMVKKKQLIYPILSHIIVDVLNLSVAVYVGIINFNHF